jgi:hypothetical protein
LVRPQLVTGKAAAINPNESCAGEESQTSLPGSSVDCLKKAVQKAAGGFGPGRGAKRKALESSSYPAQDVLFDFDLVEIFAMRFEEPRPSRYRGFHLLADGTQNTIHANIS